MIMVIVTLLGIKIDNSNHVGNEWAFEAIINGTKITEEQSVELYLKEGKLFFELKATEYDKDTPDIAIHKEIVDYHRIINDDGTPIKRNFTIEVEESGGRYHGNIATITFQFKLKEGLKVNQD